MTKSEVDIFSSDLTKCIDLCQKAISFTNITCLIFLLLDLRNKNNRLMESLLLLSKCRVCKPVFCDDKSTFIIEHFCDVKITTESYDF